MVRLTFYDGVGCIGGNKILLEDGDAGFLLDFGTSFKSEGMFFDEFLGPRNVFGLADLLTLGILPPLRGLYRADLEPPGIWERHDSAANRHSADVQGVLVSHAHLDHCGYVTYLRPEIPVITSLTTALVCKAVQDTASGTRLQEVCYITPRELKEGLLRATDSRRVPYRQRPYWVLGNAELPAEAASFWSRCDGSRRLESRELRACGWETEIGGLSVRFWPVDHSIPGAGAFGVKTSAGWVVYTGDLRLHGRNGGLTREFIVEAAGLNPTVLICEGTHPRVSVPTKEEQVLENSLEVVRRSRGLVVADFGPRNVERLISFLEIAGHTGRRLVLTSKDVYLLEALRAAGESEVPDPYAEPRIALYLKPKATLAAWEKSLLTRFVARCGERLVDAGTIRADLGSFILCFSYYDFHALLDINPPGGTYIYSSSEAFDEEMLLDQQRVWNWIDFFGLELYGTLGRERERSGFHASGHIHGPGLEELVETVRPKILVPVHTEDREFFRRFEGLCRVVFPSKGYTLTVDG